jgi:hypothetical protein
MTSGLRTWTSRIDVQEFTRFRFLLNPRQRRMASMTKSPSLHPFLTGRQEGARRPFLSNSIRFRCPDAMLPAFLAASRCHNMSGTFFAAASYLSYVMTR